MNYGRHYNIKVTPQSEKIPGSKQVANSAGGFSFAVDDWQRLQRFCILGSEGGSYYASEHKLSVENSEAVLRCIKQDGVRVVETVVSISDEGRAPKNDPALFVLAMCAGLGDVTTRRIALGALPKVARIGTHLFHFAEYVEGFRGWGRGLRNAISNWYLSKTPSQLALDVVKYQQRDGWSHRDLLRLAHPKAQDSLQNQVFHWVTQGEITEDVDTAFDVIYGFEKAKQARDAKEVVELIKFYNLPREAIPTQFLTDPKVWEALLPTMPMTAMIRNLGNMSKVGLLRKGSWDVVKYVTDTLADEEKLHRARIHPIGVLSALLTYQQGRGVRGKGEWEVVPDVVDALDEAFYKTFKFVEPTGKRIVLALDVSGSMGMGEIAGVPGLTPRMGSAAMAMVTYKTEKNVVIVAFASGTQKTDQIFTFSIYYRQNDGIVPLDISRAQRLDDVVRSVNSLPFGGTDCSLPMIWAAQNNIECDAIIVMTDSETWAGNIHPTQALDQYKQKMGIDCKLCVVGMISNGFSIADPDRNDMLDVVGFDTSTPNIVNQFIGGKI